MILEHDGCALTQIDRVPISAEDDDDLPDSVHHLKNIDGDISGIGTGNDYVAKASDIDAVAMVSEINIINHNGARDIVVKDLSLNYFHDKLITHFNILF